ncbi:protein phosphatase regulator [Knufia fluminis]|uniref:Protein phosphatase regulator n=1 Tax=Knufia fluminis TaxID=191047 RepID=A0AAN8EHQ1_9EURO|nr:protein phosphatase regulator [Knufia fluminis]
MTSLTLKPNLLRADTIDLQSQDNPSAKDHTRGQYHPAYSHAGPTDAGPHHAQALRNANHDAYSEMHTSPRLEGFNHNSLGPQSQTHMYDEDDDEDDQSHDGMNGANHEGGYGDEDGNDSQDEDMDDELLDKISSSPSIEDGKQPWPTRADSLPYGHTQGPRAAPTRGISFSPSQGFSISAHGSPVRRAVGSHQSGHESPRRGGNTNINFNNVPKLSPTSRLQDYGTGWAITESSSIENIKRHLLPEDDPFLDHGTAEGFDAADCDDDNHNWEDEDTDEDSDYSDDDQDGFSLTAEPRFLDSGWGGECLRELEDIDFEFVYALHTFVATVEGQANATKGDTMVLLDDSNSYWWLVRVVKDGSIGYLPAEHIETPTERLARLNKHRNIDLSAAMLGDNPEKSKNPLKKAMRRRNAKTVNFAPPTYYEPEAREWSDEEDEDEVEDGSAAHVEDQTTEQEQQAAQQQSQQMQQAQQVQHVDQTNEQQRVQPAAATIHHVESNDAMDEDEPLSPTRADGLAPAPLQTSSQDNLQRSRKGVVRNTDSFFKDEETKKISLTPRLLRGESDSGAPAEQEVKQRPSLDTFDKMVAEDKPKDSKDAKDSKKKEKKGMLSGLFKRKDKGGKGGKNDPDESDRISEESGRSPQSKDSMDSETAPERKPSKLQKTPPGVTSPKTSPTETRAPQRDLTPTQAQQQVQPASQKNQIGPSQQPEPSQHLGPQPQAQNPSRFPSLQEKRSVGAKISDALRSKNSSQDMGDPQVKAVYSKRAKERFAIDESDSENDSTPTAQSSILHRSISPLENNDTNAGRPGSAMRVSPMDGQEQAKDDARGPLLGPQPAEDPGPSQEAMLPEATPTSPSDQTASTSKQSPSIPTHTPSTSRSTPTWSDASLRSYMNDDQDIRDLLVIVHDKTNVTPVGPEHPLMNGLFASERTKLADMQSQLDTMLLSWLSKKNQPVGARV